MERRAMRIGKGIMTPGRISFLLPAIGALHAALALLCLAAFAAPVSAADPPAVSAKYYVERALANNPSLASMRQRIAMKENAAIRAGALDDPKGWVAVSNVPIRSWSFREEDMTGKEIGFSQMLPWPGMRSAKASAATREKEQAEFELQDMRNMLRADVKMTYAELSAVRKQAENVKRTRDVLRDIVGVSQEMYAVGKGSQPDVLRGQVESGKMREMLIDLENRERVLSMRLNTLAALRPEDAVPPLADLAEFPVTFRREPLMSVYESERPARKAVQARIRKGDASIEMAKHGYHPEFEVSFSYMQRDDTPDGMKRPDMFSSMLQMTLPIWRKEKIEPGVREMEAEKRMAVSDLAGLDLETANAMSRSLATLESRASAAALYRTTLIPQAEQSFQANVESYRVGKIDFPMLMDSVMTVLSFRRDYLAMVGEMHMERARLEAVVGGELDGAAPDRGGNAPPKTKNSDGEGR